RHTRSTRDWSSDVCSSDLINVFDIRMPPLRERGHDILLLAHSVLEEFARTNGCAPVQLTSRAEDALLTYRWPGNVRELRNVLEQIGRASCREGRNRAEVEG